jgi:hypothetical protein
MCIYNYNNMLQSTTTRETDVPSTFTVAGIILRSKQEYLTRTDQGIGEETISVASDSLTSP